MNKTLLSVVTATLVAILALASPVGLALAQDQGETIATGLNGPQGVLVDPQGNVWVADAGMGGDQELTASEQDQKVSLNFGQSARVVRIAPDGTQTVVANLPSLSTPEGLAGAARLTLLDGTLYVTNGEWRSTIDSERLDRLGSVLTLRDGELVEFADTWAFEQAQNPDGRHLHSHPYDIEAGPQGSYLWVTDAGGNSLLRVNPGSGQVSLVATFDVLPSGLPEGQGPPQSEPVPTGIAFGPDGTAYVSLLPGVPFLPGSSRVVTVSPDGQVSDFSTGLTMITDIETGPDGEIYAVSIGQFTEQGPVPNMGAILRIREGSASQVVVDGLPFPTSIAFNDAGDAYVTTNGIGAPGSGAVVRFAGLTGMEGTPLPAPRAPAVGATGDEAATGTDAQGDTGDETGPQTLPVTGDTPVHAGWMLAGAGALVAAAGLALRTRRRATAADPIRHDR